MRDFSLPKPVQASICSQEREKTGAKTGAVCASLEHLLVQLQEMQSFLLSLWLLRSDKTKMCVYRLDSNL